MRADKKKSLSKVANEVLKNPIATQQEIADKTWLSVGNVNDKLKELENEGKKDERIIQLTDKDFELMQIIQWEKFKRLSENPENVNHNDLDKWENTAVKRFSLFRWNATDEQGGLKEVIIEI